MTAAKTKTLVLTALLAALVFVATYTIRIPNPATGGYTHLGDCMIFLSVLLLGRKHGALAACIGAGFSDFLAGAPMWILPTMVIKYLMAFIMGTVIKGNPTNGKLQLIGSVLGGILQVVGYTAVNALYYGKYAAVVSFIPDTIQTAIGVALFYILARALAKPLEKFMSK